MLSVQFNGKYAMPAVDMDEALDTMPMKPSMGPTELHDPTTLTGTQPSVDAKTVKEYGSGYSKPVSLYKEAGQKRIMDGHHRAVADLHPEGQILGQTRMTMARMAH